MLSSTARLLPAFEARSDASDIHEEVKDVNNLTPSETDLEIELTPELESKLTFLSHRMVLMSKPKLFIRKGLTPINRVNDEFKILAEVGRDKSFFDTLTHQEQLAIEEYKLVMMKALQKDFQKRYGKKDKAEEKPKKSNWWRYALFGAVIVLDLLPMMVGGFLGVSTLMTSIPDASDFLVYGVSSAITAIEGVMYYSVMGPLLKKAFGIEVNEAVGPILKLQDEKLRITEDLNNKMTNEVDYADKIKYSRYQAYASLNKQFNDDVSQTKIPKFKEPPGKKLVRWGLSTLNTILNIGGGYFMATSLLALIAAPLVGTPAGWALIGLVIVGGLVGRFAIRSNSMFEMINPKAVKYEEIQKKVEKFENKNEKVNNIVFKKKLQADLIAENSKLKTGKAIYEYRNRNRTCLPGLSRKSNAVIKDIRDDDEPIVENRSFSIA